MNKKFFGLLGAGAFAASSAFIFNPAAYGLDGLDTGLRYDANGNLICINNGYLYVPTNADGTAGVPHCFTTEDYTNTPTLAPVDSSKTRSDLIAIENKSPLDHANYLGHNSYVVKPLTGDEKISPYSEEISRYSLQKNAEINRVLLGANVGWGVQANESIPVYTVDSSNPHQEYATFQTGDNRIKVFPRLTEVTMGKIPLPTWWAESWSGDHPLAIYDVATGIWRSYFYAHPDKEAEARGERVFNVAAAGYYYGQPNFGGVGDNFWLSLIQGSSSVVGLSNELTQISVDDVRKGSIDHMVSMTWYDYLNLTSFPAKQVSDGRDTYTFAPRPGQMFTLPKDMDIDAYAKQESLDEVTVMIMKAVQKYGGIITDHNLFTDAFNFEHPAGVGKYARDGKNVWQEDPTVATKIRNFKQDYFPLEKLQWLDVHYAGQATATKTADLTPAPTASIEAGQTQQYSTVDAIYMDERAFMRPSDYVVNGSGVWNNTSRLVPEGTTDLYNTTLVGAEYTPTASWVQYPKDLRSVVPVSGFTGQLVKYWTNPAWDARQRLASADSVQTKDHGTVAKWTVNVVARDQPLARTDTVQVLPGKTISIDVFANDSSEYGKADGATAFTSLKLINSKGQAVNSINTKRGYAKVNGNKIDFSALASSNGQITLTYQGTTADGRKSTGAIEIRMLGKVTAYTAADIAEISDPIPNQAGTYTPLAKEQTITTGVTPSAKNSISNVSELPAGTTFSYKSAVNTTVAGTKSAIVVVKYPDGSSEEVTVKVVVRAVSLASTNTPVYTNGTGAPNATVSIAAPKNSNGTALPSGTTFKSSNSAFKVAADGSIKVAVPVDAKNGQQLSSNITVTYYDGTTDVVPVKVTVADKVAPKITAIAAQSVSAGFKFKDITVQTNDKAATVTVTGLPGGMSFDSKTHVISGTPYVAGTYPITVKASDPSGNTSTTVFTLTVKPSEATNTNDPIYEVINGDPNTTATIPAPKNANGLPIPAGTKFTSDNTEFVVNADGSIKVAVRPIGRTGDVMSANITAVYPDGSSDVILVKLLIVDKTAPAISAIANQTVSTGQDISMVTFSISEPYATIDVTGLPAGVTYTKSWNNAIVGTPTVPGNYTVTVKATDRSGNVGTRTFTITVKGVPINTQNDPSYTGGSGTPGATVKIAAPKNSNGTALPAGTTFKSSNSAFTVAADGSINVAVPANAKNGDSLSANITVTYGDGTTDVVPVKVSITDKTAPTITTPSDLTLEKGEAVSNVAIKTNDTAASVTVTGLPAGLTYNAKTGAITGTPTTNGSSTITVKAVDPSGNASSKTFKITVKTTPANQRYNPVYTGVTAAPGTTAKVAAPKSNGSALPAGVKFSSSNSAFKVAADGSLTVAVAANAKNGDSLTSNITVTYADGTTDVAAVKVTVGDKVAPVISGLSNQSVTVGKAMNNVIVKTNDAYATVAVSGLPTGVSYNTKTGVISGTPTKIGNYTVTVKATDLSGNVATSTFTISVKAAAIADQYSPIYFEGTAQPNGTANLPAPKSTNGATLPAGTTFTSSNTAFKIAADGSVSFQAPATAKNGDVFSSQITVKYSDGTTDVVTVKVTVNDKIAPAIANIADQNINEGQAMNRVAVLTNDSAAVITVSGLPAGVTYDAKTGIISGTPTAAGNYTISVKAVDPSGNTSVKSFKLNVKAVAQNVKYTPTYLKAASTPGTTVKIAAPKNSDGAALPSGTTYKSDNATFQTDAKTGAITVVVPATAKNGDVLSAKITVAYPDGTSEQVPVSVTVGDKVAPVIATMDNQDIIIGDTITDIAVQTNDPTAKVTVTGLPDGVTYQAVAGSSGAATTYTTGIISGAPKKIGKSTVTVKAVDASGNTSTKTFTITVNSVPMTSSNTPSYISGSGVPGVVLSILAPTNVNGSSMPEGTTYVSDNPAFVVDEGGNVTVQIPADAKDGDVLAANITATYPDGTSDVLPVSVTVSDQVAPLLSEIAPQTATKDQAIEPIAVQASDSAANVTVSGLPDGVTYNAETGIISGTPTVTGEFTVSVLATDLSGNSSTRNFIMTVNEAAAPAPTDPVTPAPSDPVTPDPAAPVDPAPAPSDPTEAPAEPAQPVETTDPAQPADPVAPVDTVSEAPAEQPAENVQPVVEQNQAEVQQPAVEVVTQPAMAPTTDPSSVSVPMEQTVGSATDQATQSAAPYTFIGGSSGNGGYTYSGGSAGSNSYYQSRGNTSALANTGANVVGWGLAGISAMAGGVVVLGARRRKEERYKH